MIGARPGNETTHALARETDARGAWATLASVLTHAHDNRGDPEAATLALRVLVQIGQGELARSQADSMPAEITARADVRTLVDRARALPPMEFEAADRIALGIRNVEHLLARRGVDLRAEYESWSAGEDGWRVLATPDGNVIRRPRDAHDPRRWLWLSEQRSAARSFVHAHFANASSDEIAPIAVEGLNPPWVFVEIANATPRLPGGYQPRLRVLQRDAAEFFEGASLIDLRSFIDDDRIEWFVGPDAGERFAAAVRTARRTQAIGAGVPIGTVRATLDPPLGERINALATEIVGEGSAAAQRVRARYADRDEPWWAARFERALAPGSDDPLRVLIPTTRYSTYIQHAARDLAGAFEQRGARTEVLIEPDDHTRLGPLAFHEAFEEFEPDLVVLINYPRSARAEAFPPGVPFVCWIQDEMPHLYDAEVGRAQGPLDFVVGHAVTSLFAKHGYDPARALFAPVAVSERKFHAGPITPSQRERFTCDIAFVSNHSETPDELHERKRSEADDPRVRAVLDAIRPGVQEVADDLMGRRASAALGGVCRRALAAMGTDGAESESYQIQYARPMLERIVRHRTLGWAADVCDRRGWTLRVFGRGWETHPRFGAHTGGVIEHGDDLRACYQAASVNLHASALCLVHQRVMECALSGGLPIGVRSLATLPALADVLTRAGLTPEAAARAPDDRRVAFATANHPELTRHAALLGRMGATDTASPEAVIRADHLRRALAHPRARGALSYDAPWLFGDPAALTFADAGQLEQLVSRARDDHAWRRARSDEIAQRVRERATTGGLVEGMLGLVQGALGEREIRRTA